MYPSEEIRSFEEGILRHAGSRIGDALTSVSPPITIDDSSAKGINGAHLDDLTEAFLIVIAEAIQSWIDAGSERDVTMENEELHKAIRNELKGWSSAWNEA